MLVDCPSSIQTEVRGWESACWRWPHTGQCVLREISGESVKQFRFLCLADKESAVFQTISNVKHINPVIHLQKNEILIKHLKLKLNVCSFPLHFFHIFALRIRNYHLCVIGLISFDFIQSSPICALSASDELLCIIVCDNSLCSWKLRSCIHCWWVHLCYYQFASFQHLSFGTVFDNKSLSESLIVNAAFQQTLWSVAPICSGGGVAQGKFDNWLLCPRNVKC